LDLPPTNYTNNQLKRPKLDTPPPMDFYLFTTYCLFQKHCVKYCLPTTVDFVVSRNLRWVLPKKKNCWGWT
jgi:hypothetical protein